MKVEEIAEAIARLPPDQLARFRRWFTAFEAGRTDRAEELDSTATKLGRLAGRAFAELKSARNNREQNRHRQCRGFGGRGADRARAEDRWQKRGADR
jgi:hypothetical protein